MVVRKPKYELFATENEFDPGLYLFFFLFFLPCQWPKQSVREICIQQRGWICSSYFTRVATKCNSVEEITLRGVVAESKKLERRFCSARSRSLDAKIRTARSKSPTSPASFRAKEPFCFRPSGPLSIISCISNKYYPLSWLHPMST